MKNISDAFQYAFTNWKRLFNFWWAIIPIIGWLAVTGYFVEIVENLLKKKDKELPEFKGFWRLFKKGFVFFLVMIVPVIIMSAITGILGFMTQGSMLLTILYYAIAVFLDLYLAMLFINYIKKKDYSSVYDVKLVWEKISKNWNKTLNAVLKQVVLELIFIAISLLVIPIIVTIPAMIFTGYYFLVELYNNS